MINKKSGFTLLEILLVIGIIAVLAGIVIVAINPSKTLATVRNSERKSDLKQIDSALSQYYIDNNEYPASLTSVSSLTEICDTGTATSGHTILCNDLVDLSILVPTYLTAIPTDPSATTTTYAGYKIVRTGRRISLSAPAELGQTITRGADTYSVTYNGNGNTGGTIPSTQTKTENITLTLKTNSGTLTKNGYTFAGWNTLANGSGTNYAEGANYTTNAGVTLFAKWTVSDACSHVPSDPDCWSIATSSLAWGPTGTTTGLNENTTAIDDGPGNTITLVNRTGTYSAAEYCDALDEGGHTDWYLPAINQLITGLQAYRTQYLLGDITWGGFVYGTWYWSSTEYSGWPTNQAWMANTSVGGLGYGGSLKNLSTNKTHCLR